MLGIDSRLNMGDDGREMGDFLPSVDLGTGRTATAIAVGNTHSCALLDNASVKCWGGNAYGELVIDSSSSTKKCRELFYIVFSSF